MIPTNSVWELKGITKSFSGVPVLSGVNLKLFPGETHSLLGCNGAGKSTLVKIMSGHIQPDSGSMLINGRPVSFKSSRDALLAGIAISTQELMLFPDMSITDNLFMNLPETYTLPFIHYPSVREQARVILKRMQINAEPDRKVAELSHSEKYLVQFARCWLRRPKLLILDEISAPLTHDEFEMVRAMIGELKKTGTAILYITQRMQDIMAISDRLTILRDGQVAASPAVDSTSQSELRAHIFGETINKLYPKLPIPLGEQILEVSDVETPYVHNVNFCLRRGEILGVMGNSGSGRSRLLRAISGIDPLSSGTIRYKGRLNNMNGLIHDIAYLPEDRDAQALFINLDCSKNITIRNLERVMTHGFLNLFEEDLVIQNAIDRLGIQAQDGRVSIQHLSGGNKQKVVIARFLHSNCSVYLFDEPTQGIDTAGKVEIFNIISELARRGAGIILVSSEFSELIGMCDSILLIKSGTIIAQCSPEDLSSTDDSVFPE